MALSRKQFDEHYVEMVDYYVRREKERERDYYKNVQVKGTTPLKSFITFPEAYDNDIIKEKVYQMFEKANADNAKTSTYNSRKEMEHLIRDELSRVASQGSQVTKDILTSLINTSPDGKIILPENYSCITHDAIDSAVVDQYKADHPKIKEISLILKNKGAFIPEEILESKSINVNGNNTIKDTTLLFDEEYLTEDIIGERLKESYRTWESGPKDSNFDIKEIKFGKNVKEVPSNIMEILQNKYNKIKKDKEDKFFASLTFYPSFGQKTKDFINDNFKGQVPDITFEGSPTFTITKESEFKTGGEIFNKSKKITFNNNNMPSVQKIDKGSNTIITQAFFENSKLGTTEVHFGLDVTEIPERFALNSKGNMTITGGSNIKDFGIMSFASMSQSTLTIFDSLKTLEGKDPKNFSKEEKALYDECVTKINENWESRVDEGLHNKLNVKFVTNDHSTFSQKNFETGSFYNTNIKIFDDVNDLKKDQTKKEKIFNHINRLSQFSLFGTNSAEEIKFDRLTKHGKIDIDALSYNPFLKYLNLGDEYDGCNSIGSRGIRNCGKISSRGSNTLTIPSCVQETKSDSVDTKKGTKIHYSKAGHIMNEIASAPSAVVAFFGGGSGVASMSSKKELMRSPVVLSTTVAAVFLTVLSLLWKLVKHIGGIAKTKMGENKNAPKKGPNTYGQENIDPEEVFGNLPSLSTEKSQDVGFEFMAIGEDIDMKTLKEAVEMVTQNCAKYNVCDLFLSAPKSAYNILTDEQYWNSKEQSKISASNLLKSIQMLGYDIKDKDSLGFPYMSDELENKLLNGTITKEERLKYAKQIKESEKDFNSKITNAELGIGSETEIPFPAIVDGNGDYYIGQEAMTELAYEMYGSLNQEFEQRYNEVSNPLSAAYEEAVNAIDFAIVNKAYDNPEKMDIFKKQLNTAGEKCSNSQDTEKFCKTDNLTLQDFGENKIQKLQFRFDDNNEGESQFYDTLKGMKRELTDAYQDSIKTLKESNKDFKETSKKQYFEGYLQYRGVKSVNFEALTNEISKNMTPKTFDFGANDKAARAQKEARNAKFDR